MIAESQIRSKLGRFLVNEITLDQFEDWLVQRSWNMQNDSSESAQRLASAIELRLAEYSSGHLEEQAMREELRPFVSNYVFRVSFGDAKQPTANEDSSSNVVANARPLVVAQGAFRRGESRVYILSVAERV